MLFYYTTLWKGYGRKVVFLDVDVDVDVDTPAA